MLSNHKSTNFNLYFYVFIIAFTLLRVLTASSVDFGVDEAHYVLYGLNLDLSYFDHPPMVGWSMAPFLYLFGTNELAARIPAILTALIVSIFIFQFIKEKFNSEKAAFYSVVAINSSFILDGLFLMYLPENPLFILIFPIIFYTAKIFENASLKNYIILGVLLGLAGLSKYTAVLFIPPILLLVFIKRRFDLIFNFKFLILIAIALVCISPVIIWNMQNDWISFAYQTNHVVGSNEMKFSTFGRNLLTQIAGFSPFISFLAFYAFYKTLRSKDIAIQLTTFIASFIFLFFVYSSLYKHTLPHWNGLVYLLLLPLGVAFFIEKKEKLTKILIAISLFISVFLHLELTFKFLPLDDYKSVHRDIYGWPEITQKAKKYGNNIAVMNWTLASRATYYGQEKDLTTYLIDRRFDQFDLWQKDSPIGKNLVFIDTRFYHKEIKKIAKCDEYKNLETFDILLNERKVNTVKLIECVNFQGVK